VALRPPSSAKTPRIHQVAVFGATLIISYLYCLEINLYFQSFCMQFAEQRELRPILHEKKKKRIQDKDSPSS
jgi:hypothetical protein